MAVLTLREVLDKARAGDYGVGAFNVTDTVQAEAVLEAARLTESPVILQTIHGSSPFASEDLFWRLLNEIVADFNDVPVVLHLDHGPEVDICKRAVDSGFSSVMIDGSINPNNGEPNSLSKNIELTAAAAEYARAHGVSVEGELGTIGGSEDGEIHSEIILADPEEAEEFVQATGVDALAVAIGTSHGAYKFNQPPVGSVLQLGLISEIATKVPNTHLVLHGSSSLPAELREKINKYGGSMEPSWGVDDSEKQEAIKRGVTKINQGMDSHMAFIAELRRELASDGVTADPASAIRAGRIAMRDIIAKRMHVFGQAGKARDFLLD